MASDRSMPEAVELTDSNRSVSMGSSSGTGLAVPVDQDRDHARGGERTPAITLVEYGDYECPYSRAAYRSVQQIEQQLGDRLDSYFGISHFGRSIRTRRSPRKRQRRRRRRIASGTCTTSCSRVSMRSRERT